MSMVLVCPGCGKKLAIPETAAGKQAKCPSCSLVFSVPSEVHDVEQPDAGPAPGAGYAPQQESGAPSPEDDAPRKPCPLCGEMIIASAAKCRYCGSYLDARLQHEMMRENSQRRSRDEDSQLTAVDWLLAILCSGIGCIMGIIWLIQGKPKGAKMLGISVLAAIFWNVINVLIQMSIHPHNFR